MSFWDLVSSIYALTWRFGIPLETSTVVELLFLAIHLYSFVDTINAFLRESYERARMDGFEYDIPPISPQLIILWVPIMYESLIYPRSTSCVLTTRQIRVIDLISVFCQVRDYLGKWRYKRDCRKIKPLIVFTTTGSPVVVLPRYLHPPGTASGRLSVDSLQQVVQNEDES